MRDAAALPSGGVSSSRRVHLRVADFVTSEQQQQQLYNENKLGYWSISKSALIRQS